jgi:hypothetical protein
MEQASTGRDRTLLAGLALAALAGCASGERFGDAAAKGAGGGGADCVESADCWDGDPATEDTCTPDGECAFLSSVKPDAEKDSDDIGNECHAVAEISGDAEIDAEVAHLVSEVAHTIPVEFGTLYRIAVAAPGRLEVVLQDAGVENVMFVLLEDCANACANRIAWGRELCSPVLAPGSYFLAVFSGRVYEVDFFAEFLEPADSCNGLDAVPEC